MIVRSRVCVCVCGNEVAFVSIADAERRMVAVVEGRPSRIYLSFVSTQKIQQFYRL